MIGDARLIFHGASPCEARCSVQHDPMSCVNALENPLAPPHEIQNPTGQKPDYA